MSTTYRVTSPTGKISYIQGGFLEVDGPFVKIMRVGDNGFGAPIRGVHSVFPTGTTIMPIGGDEMAEVVETIKDLARKLFEFERSDQYTPEEKDLILKALSSEFSKI